MTRATVRTAAVSIVVLLLMTHHGNVDAFSTEKSTRTTSRRGAAATSMTSLHASGSSSSRHLIEIRDSNFRDLFRAEQPVLIDCCAQWCGPCKLIEPTLGECAKKWNDQLVVGKYDVESGNDEVKVELLMQGVMPQSLPSLILMHRNTVLAVHKGIIRPAELDAWLEEHVGVGRELASVFGARASSEAPRQKSGLISFAGGAGSDDDYMLKEA